MVKQLWIEGKTLRTWSPKKIKLWINILFRSRKLVKLGVFLYGKPSKPRYVKKNIPNILTRRKRSLFKIWSEKLCKAGMPTLRGTFFIKLTLLLWWKIWTVYTRMSVHVKIQYIPAKWRIRIYLKGGSGRNTLPVRIRNLCLLCLLRT